MTVRTIHRLAPDGSTTRYRPLPSQYLPGVLMLRTCTAVSALSGCARRGFATLIRGVSSTIRTRFPTLAPQKMWDGGGFGWTPVNHRSTIRSMFIVVFGRQWTSLDLSSNPTLSAIRLRSRTNAGELRRDVSPSQRSCVGGPQWLALRARTSAKPALKAGRSFCERSDKAKVVSPKLRSGKRGSHLFQDPSLGVMQSVRYGRPAFRRNS